MFVTPFALWTAFMLKTGEMMLASMRPPQARPPAPTVGVIPDPEAPPREEAKPRVRKKAKAKALPKKTKPKTAAKAAAKPKAKAKRRSKR